MQPVGYMLLEGQHHGVIGSNQTDRSGPGEIKVIEFLHHIEPGENSQSARDIFSASSMVITKKWDRYSPTLQKAVLNGEFFKNITISWFHTDIENSGKLLFRHTLRNSKITKIIQRVCLSESKENTWFHEDLYIKY